MSNAFLCDACRKYFAYLPEVTIRMNSEMWFLDYPKSAIPDQEMHLCRDCAQDFAEWLLKHAVSSKNHLHLGRSEAQIE